MTDKFIALHIILSPSKVKAAFLLLAQIHAFNVGEIPKYLNVKEGSQLSIPFSVDLSNGLVDCGDFPLGFASSFNLKQSFLRIDAEFGRINGSRIKVLQGKVEINGEALWKKMRYDGEILPKEIALKFQHCLGNTKNNSACRLSNTPRRIEGALEIDDLTVDMSGKIVLINVSCGNDYILKQSILQVWKEGVISIKKMVIL